MANVTTEPDEFGLFRIFTQYPTHQPDEFISLDDYCDANTFYTAPAPVRNPKSVFGLQTSSDPHPFDTESSSSSFNPFAPFPNASTYYMMKFAYNGNDSDGLAYIQRLNDEVIQQPDFDPKDLHGFSARKEAKRLDAPNLDAEGLPFNTHAGWKKSSIKLSLPCTGSKTREEKAPTVDIDGVIHRDLLDVMREAYSSEAASEYHLRGYKQMWERDGYPKPIRVHGEVYSSDAFLNMEKEVLTSPPEPGCNLEHVVAPIMMYSDSTHLASFGTASICPGYLWFGSQSKYTRAKPTKFAAHHLVYFPSLPNQVEDAYTKIFGLPLTDAMKTHLKRELEHEVWKLLLTPEFLDAYVHGVVVKGPDGVLRRLYPRIFTYSADYPEKYIFLNLELLYI
ncbi:hypothetical protein BDP27DRAFT_1212847 [Rhodocollybia butyracea]|uniref:Uncharacterized protein n=1 Tax=Rhodocollybia butyracea TaxID=206335 RepID=A0A9P5PZ07_9AGAR|nr:hypothetical protein BDP27DRAFT_1212847 [Rhodocollybia butyracea]